MSIPTSFGELVFNDAAMKARLPAETYLALKQTIGHGKPLGADIAGIVAAAMKDWAIEKGATHFTHWFQPLTGCTAEKHDGFLSPASDGSAILEFSTKELITSEPDASSFPSGGLRATFEARGYTAWDPTSYAFIKDATLCIPTIFLSYSGDALDTKTPLLRSMQLLDVQARRILKLFGHINVGRVTSTAGPEQEYFLVRKDLFDKRPDLLFCSRTLFGAPSPKGQELEDHYFGAISPRVMAFMRDADEELWKLGVFAKTEHKEVAPGQYELACVYSDTNTATDHNQLVMEVLRNAALRHGLVCLLHEKPFAGINGSGKHNNWSLSTDTGLNLLEPGKSPKDNLQFLLFLAAITKAVDEYQDLLRISVASAGNDQRLGGFEAPPAIISVYLGDTLSELLSSIERKEDYIEGAVRMLESGISVVPELRMDTTDRNRTSPFAFTGNKFEFRMPGSSQSIADVNTVLNTIVAESLSGFADELETAEDFRREAFRIIRHTVRDHKSVLFGGNGYSDEWPEEALSRGLLNLPTTADALPYLIKEKNIALYTKHSIFTERELRSRYEIQLENYSKVVHIEASTMLSMARRTLLPATMDYQRKLAEDILAKQQLRVNSHPESTLLTAISENADVMYAAIDALQKAMDSIPAGAEAEANHCKDVLVPAMRELRTVTDTLESLSARGAWPIPSYEELLFSL
ncbi:MAG: glutamine synthetase III [Christensenellaceae bacterium]|jgi:glutamine synthetase|nr:glutamine synthetase III [Christensenellaceae bacterium]